MDARGRQVYGEGDEDVVEGEHNRADGDDGQDQLGALCSVRKGDAEQAEEDHARDQGDFSPILIRNVAHDGVGYYAYGLEERCVDPYLQGGELQIFAEVDWDEDGDDVIAQRAESREYDHGDEGTVFQKDAGGGEILFEGGDTLLALEIPEGKPHQDGSDGSGMKLS